MDNASKALIMAGAILISVAIVGIGIYIFSTASALTDDAVGQIDAIGISAVNADIEKYEGDNVRGSEVKQLIRTIKTKNAQDVFPNDVTVTDISPVDNKRYTVTIAYDDSGYVNAVTISDNSAQQQPN